MQVGFSLGFLPGEGRKQKDCHPTAWICFCLYKVIFFTDSTNGINHGEFHDHHFGKYLFLWFTGSLFPAGSNITQSSKTVSILCGGGEPAPQGEGNLLVFFRTRFLFAPMEFSKFSKLSCWGPLN